MKKNTKKLTCIALALVAAATLTVAAFAAEYASAPNFSDKPSQSTNVTTGTLKDAIKDAAENDKGIAVATIEAASTNNITLSANVMKALADKENVILSIEAGSVTIEINSASIINTKKINLSMDVKSTDKKTVIDFRSNADFGCDVKVVINNCKLSEKQLESARVYLDGEDIGAVQIDENGLPFIIASKGGKYEIK